VNTVLRGVLSVVTAVATFYFAVWTVGALLSGLGLPFLLAPLVAALLAALAARQVWRRAQLARGGPLSYAATGAAVTGALGFCAGFFGPMLLSPESNQGPLLGIFITGPLGVVLGGVGGGLYWFLRVRER
jgi:hypothetical protein